MRSTPASTLERGKPAIAVLAEDQEIRVQQFGFGVVAQRLTAYVDDSAAGSFNDRMRCRRVPFAGGSEARIKIRTAFCDQTELQ